MPSVALDRVMDVELTPRGGHILMGTDAVESMGFIMTPGNNLHINLAPDSRAEADRLFNALAAGDMVDMPLQGMFWSAYFGSLKDRFGIHWRVNCTGTT